MLAHTLNYYSNTLAALVEYSSHVVLKQITNSSSSEDEGINGDQSRSEQAYMRMLKKHKKRRIENIVSFV